MLSTTTKKNNRIENRVVPKKSSVRSYFVKNFSRNSIITSIIILIVIFILYSISSNGGIVGKWHADQESGLTMTFKSDGTLLMEAGGTVISPAGLKYKIIDNKTLSIGVGTNTLTTNYEITNGKLSLTDESGKLQFTKISSENIMSSMSNSINKLFSSISLDTCPQLPMKLIKSGQISIYGRGDEELKEQCPTYSAEYGSDRPCVFYGEYHPVNSVSKLTGGIWVSPSAHLICRDAKYEGENRNYLYCDLGARYRDPISFMNNIFSGTDDTIPYIVKKPKEQGEIIEKQNILRKSFMNIYTTEGTFVKTVCGPDPDEVQKQKYEKSKKEFKETMRDIDDFFTI